MNITVRDLDEETFRKFKGKAAENGMKMGQAVAHAMRLFIENTQDNTAQKRAPKRRNWNANDATSKEIDSLLSGR